MRCITTKIAIQDSVLTRANVSNTRGTIATASALVNFRDAARPHLSRPGTPGRRGTVPSRIGRARRPSSTAPAAGRLARGRLVVANAWLEDECRPGDHVVERGSVVHGDRRFVHGGRGLAEQPIEFHEVPQAGERVSVRPCCHECGELLAVLGDAGSPGRIDPDECASRLGEEFRTHQPGRGRESRQERRNQTGVVVAVVNRQTVARVEPARE